MAQSYMRRVILLEHHSATLTIHRDWTSSRVLHFPVPVLTSSYYLGQLDLPLSRVVELFNLIQPLALWDGEHFTILPITILDDSYA